VSYDRLLMSGQPLSLVRSLSAFRSRQH